jgi:hypothetical protein
MTNIEKAIKFAETRLVDALAQKADIADQLAAISEVVEARRQTVSTLIQFKDLDDAAKKVEAEAADAARLDDVAAEADAIIAGETEE